MLDLLTKYADKPAQYGLKFRDHLKTHWKPNVTMLDVVSYNAMAAKDEYDLGHNPFDAIRALGDRKLPAQSRSTRRLYDYVAPFFVEVADGLRQMAGRVCVEVTLGDCLDVAEKIHHGVYGPVTGDSSEVRPSDFPVRYDKIHLSNIP